MSGPDRLRTTILVAGALLILTVAYTWPLAAHLRSTVPHDRGDPLLVTWILWWSTKTMPLTERWWNAPAFYPASGVFAFSENLLSLAPITAPILKLSTSPVLAYNVAFMLSYALSGLSAYMLAFVLTSRHDASFVAAVAFAFAPYRLSHLSHLQLLSSYWMPVALAALHMYARNGRARAAALFAAAWVMQSLASGYYLLFLSLLVLLWIIWFALGRLGTRRLAVLAAWWVGAAIVVAPVFIGYRTIHARYGLKRSPVEIQYYSADIAGLASASRDSLLWGRVHAIDHLESELFPGLTTAILFGCGLLLLTRRTAGKPALIFYVASAALMWILALGPHPTFMGKPIGIAGPYALLMYVPGFDEMRVPARLWMLAVLCLSVVAALAVAQLRSGVLRRAVAVLIVAGLLLDGWPRSFSVAAAPDLRPSHGVAVARLGLPLAQNETESMYQTLGDGLPVFNGYSGYEAPQHAPLQDLLERHDREILDRLAADGPIQIVVEHTLDPDRSWRGYVEAAGATLLDSGADWTRYELPRKPRAQQPAAVGTDVRILRVDANVNPADVNAMFDGDLNTRWHAARQDGNETVTIDLGTAHAVRWIVMCLGTYASQYPRSLTVDTSMDGVTWATAWSGRTALPAYDAAVSDPRVIPIPLAIQRAARFVRLHQTSVEPAHSWTIVELRVLE
jgi:F5/8 type C domain